MDMASALVVASAAAKYYNLCNLLGATYLARSI